MYRGLRSRLGTVIAGLAVALLIPAGAHAATADLAISTSDSPGPGDRGRRAHLRAHRFQSRAGERERGDVVTDELPSQVAFVSASASQGSCDIKGKT